MKSSTNWVTGHHYKNGATLKSQMSKTTFIKRNMKQTALLILTLIAINAIGQTSNDLVLTKGMTIETEIKKKLQLIISIQKLRQGKSFHLQKVSCRLLLTV
jgi:hypothetical protein